MNKEDYGVVDRYNHEILEIANKLNDLENGRIYEFSKWQQDGYLATNAQELRKMIKELLYKIESRSPSVHDELAELFKKKE